MPYQGDMRAAALGEILAYCQKATAQDCIATLRSLSELLQIDVLRLLRLPVGAAPPDAAGAAVTGNPMLVGGREAATGFLRALAVDANGILNPRIGVTDAGGPVQVLTDRTNILAVAPPVSKLWFASGRLTGAGTPTATQAAPGAGLRNIILAWCYSLASGVAQGVSEALFQSPTGTTIGSIALAVPAGDSRMLSGNGPIICPVNSTVSLSGPGQGAGQIGSAWMCGYVASFP